MKRIHEWPPPVETCLVVHLSNGEEKLHYLDGCQKHVEDLLKKNLTFSRVQISNPTINYKTDEIIYIEISEVKEPEEEKE